MGETLAMTFLPFIIAGFYHLLKGEKKKWYYLVIGFSGVLQTHVLSFVLVCIFATVCCLLYFRDLFRGKRILLLLKAALFTTLLNLWFVIPFIYFYLLEDLGTSALVLGGYTFYSVNPSYFTYMINNNEYYYLSFGIPVICCFIFGLIYLLFNKKEDKQDRDSYLTFLYIIACILAIMITGYSASEKMMQIGLFKQFFNFLQFPWRLFAPSSALIIFVASIWITESKLVEQHQLKKVIFCVLIGINMLTGMVTSTNGSHFAYNQYDDTYSIGHTAKVRGILNEDWTVLYPYEWRLHRVSEESIFTDLYPTDYENTKIVDYNRKGTTTDLTYVAANDGAKIIFPIMGYHGYHAYDETGKELQTELSNHYALQVPLKADGNEHEIRIVYKIPDIFKIAVILSGLTAIYIFIREIIYVIKIKK